jgi:hypothetical protein
LDRFLSHCGALETFSSLDTSTIGMPTVNGVIVAPGLTWWLVTENPRHKYRRDRNCDRAGMSSWEALLRQKLWINDQQNQQRHRDQAKYRNASQHHVFARQNILRPSLVFGHGPRSPLEWLRSM